ncbi:MAG TPA: hypothetical protein VN673_09355, partial [Clostridia bacterium]|nr:hypothetical protein [Clostridia bacterium]
MRVICKAAVVRGAYVCCLALGLLAEGRLIAAAPASPPTNSPVKVAIPKPVPAPAGQLPESFKKLTPASIADLKDIEQHVKALTEKVSRSVLAVEVGDGT